jgi:hypothetical protein
MSVPALIVPRCEPQLCSTQFWIYLHQEVAATSYFASSAEQHCLTTAAFDCTGNKERARCLCDWANLLARSHSAWEHLPMGDSSMDEGTCEVGALRAAGGSGAATAGGAPACHCASGGGYSRGVATLTTVAEHMPDVITAVAAWLDPASTARLRGAARCLRGPCEHDSLWIAACEQFGYDRAPLRPKAMLRAPWLQVFRSHVLPRREVPLTGVASIFGPAYYCIVNAVVFTKGTVSLRIHERGDMSLGPVQNPQSSSLRGSVMDNVRAARRRRGPVRSASMCALQLGTISTSGESPPPPPLSIPTPTPPLHRSWAELDVGAGGVPFSRQGQILTCFRWLVILRGGCTSRTRSCDPV